MTLDRPIEEIVRIIRANTAAGRPMYYGLRSSEIGSYSRRLMFGEHDEAFPDADTWSKIVD